MGLFNYLSDVKPAQETKSKSTSTETVQNTITQDTSAKTDAEYFNIIDEETGKRFNIPLLDVNAPGYYHKYINYMQLRERSPETFAKILGWE